MNDKEFIKAYKQEYRTILAVLQKVGIDYINSGHQKGRVLRKKRKVRRKEKALKKRKRVRRKG